MSWRKPFVRDQLQDKASLIFVGLMSNDLWNPVTLAVRPTATELTYVQISEQVKMAIREALR